MAPGFSAKEITGRFSGKKDKRVHGIFNFGDHYPADEQYPEEDCSTGPLEYSAERGGEDVVPANNSGA